MDKKFTTEKTDSIFYGNYSIVESEINYSHTVSFSHLVDLTRVEEVRRSCGDGIKPTYTAFIAKAIALAMQDFPFVNRRFYRPFGIFPRRFQNFKTVDISIASETDIPNAEYVSFIDVLRQAEVLSLEEITSWLYQLRTRPEENEQWKMFRALLTRYPRWLAKWLIRIPLFFPTLWVRYRGGAVLISSPAKYGVDAVVGSWPSPLGVSFGLVKDRALVKDGCVVACPSFFLLLNFDRRLMAGAPAARFFHRVIDILETWPAPAS